MGHDAAVFIRFLSGSLSAGDEIYGKRSGKNRFDVTRHRNRVEGSLPIFDSNARF
jgi:hypothetical protein